MSADLPSSKFGAGYTYGAGTPHIPPPVAKPQPFGHYRLLTLLGRGGMGEVWRAHDTETNRVVALKLLPANSLDKDFEQRFRREALAAAALNEPHVVPIHRFGEIDGRLYVDMRLVEGSDLEAILATGPLVPIRAVAIIEQVAAALHAAHQTALVHRDVKPSNVLVTKSDFAYLIDFGIARTASEAGLTSPGTTIGTLAYMAPERFSTNEIDPRIDVYALACVLYQCLSGQRPYPGDSMEQQVAGHISIPPPRPSVRPGVPVHFDAVIATGMAKDPAQRYRSTVELASAARAALTSPVIQQRGQAPIDPGLGPSPGPWFTPPPPNAFAPGPAPRPDGRRDPRRGW